MANKNHVDALNAGLHSWNSWRVQNADVRPDLSDADLQARDLDYFDLRGANLQHANLSGARAIGAQFDRASLVKGRLRDARLADATFAGAHLSEADLSGADLSGCNFSDAQLDQSRLTDARAVAAQFRRADLNFCDLSNADLTRAGLVGTILTGARLTGTNLRQAALDGAVFERATLGNTIFADTDLSHCIGLETCMHRGPSSLDVRTVARSGELASPFLRGCGLSDTFIDYLPSLLTAPIQFYSCFISYSVRDESFATQLHADLQNAGVRCWFAPEDMKIGDRIRDRIDQSIRVHDKLLIVLSHASISSQWVEKEVETAFEHERVRNTTILFPIRLDDEVMKTGKSWAADIRRTRNIGNFITWNDRIAYQTALQRLLRDLRATNVNPAGPDADDDIPF